MKPVLSSLIPAGLCITLINALARGAHLIFFITIGNRFGADTHTDTVLFLQAPLLVLMSVVAGTLEAVIMPSMHRATQTNSASELIRSLIKWTCGCVLILTILLMAISVLISGKTDPLLVLILFPIPMLAALSSLFMGILNARKQYIKAVTGPFFGVFASIPLAFLLPVSSVGLAFLLLCFEIGRFAGLWIQCRSILADYQPGQAGQASTHVLSWALNGAKYQAIGSLLIGMTPFIDYLFARPLGAGAVTHVEYAGRLWNLVPVLFNGPLVLFFSKVSQAQAASGKGIKKKMVHCHALKMAFFASLIGAAAILCSKTGIHLLYGFGKMDAAQRLTLSSLLSCYLIGAGPFLGGLIYVRALSAEGRINIITLAAGFGFITNLIFNFIFVGIWGLNGIGLSTGLTYLVTMIIMGCCFEFQQTQL